MKYSYSFILSFLLIISAFKISGQNAYSDSLEQAVNNATEPEQKIKTLFLLVEESLYRDANKCLLHLESLIKIAKDNKLKTEEGRGYLWKGRSYIINYDYNLSLENLQKADKIFSEQKDSFYLAKVYNGIGILKSYNSEYSEAIKYQFNAVSILEKVGKPVDVGSSYNSIGTLYTRLHDTENAKKYYQLSIEALENDPKAQLTPMMNLSGLMDNDNREKLDILNNAFAQSYKLEMHRMTAGAASALSQYYEKTELNKDSMRHYYNLAIEYGNLANDPLTVAYNELYLAVLDGETQPLKSIDKLNKLLENPILKSDQDVVSFGYHELSKLQAQANMYKSAYSNLDSATHYYKEVYNTELSAQTASANARFESEKKDAQLARQQLEINLKEKQQNIIIGSSIGILLVLSLLYLWYYQKQKVKKKEAEFELLVQQKEAEKLMEIDDMKNQFFTNVSHELRTPLSLILGPLSDVMEKSEDDQTQKSVHLAYHNAERLLEMVNEVLELSKLESGHIKIEKKDIFLPSFIKRVLYAFESMAQIRNINLQVGAIPEVALSADSDKLEKILNNLISNAIKYSENGSSIDLEVSNSDNLFTFNITDYGKGIHPSETDKIFNRFYQSNVVTAVEGGGTGVGLALSRELAELLGGTLTVTSELGKGSTFSLRIPLEKTDEIIQTPKFESPSAQPESYSPILINGQKPHILIIEDNHEMAEYIGSILNNDYRCSFVKDGYAALQKIQVEKFDLISSDVMMPHMDGFQLKQKLNKINGVHAIPFIFLTARTLEEDKIAGLKLGVDDYITKPFNKYEYKARINNLLKNKVEREEARSELGIVPENQTNIEEELLKAAEKSVLKNIADQEYKVADLAKELNYSQRQLTRIVKNLTGMTPVNFILELRLQRAYYLLKRKSFHTVTEVMYEVGIGSASYFGRKFKERFGISPGEVK